MEEHEEVVFNPDDEFWEEKLRDLFDNIDDGQAGPEIREKI